jgi:hypothetical protein
MITKRFKKKAAFFVNAVPVCSQENYRFVARENLLGSQEHFNLGPFHIYFHEIRGSNLLT